MTGAYSITQHNSTSPPPQLKETYRHCNPMARQRLQQYEPEHYSIRLINQLTACTVSGCRHAGAYLDTVPVSPSLHLSDADFICGGQFCLGATGRVGISIN